MQKLSSIKLRLNQSEGELLAIATKTLGHVPAHFRILKKSIDARNKNDVHYVYTVEFGDERVEKQQLERIDKSKIPDKPIVIVGSGPAGLFCAIRLIERGFAPIVIERGDCVEKRIEKCNALAFGVLDTQSNIQFGEGGAGTFSDGKLNTQTHDSLISEVLEKFVFFGAPPEIEWLSKPHVGSDNLKNVVVRMRSFIQNNGGQVLFNTRLDDIKTKDGRIETIKIISEGEEKWLDVSALVLAIGHSARDTFEMLLSRGVFMRAKDFAIGARIEHLQSNISLSQYGKGYALLPPADYKLVSHTPDRAAFTFCMCPGGEVTVATSEEGGVVTNGMSNYARDGVNANSALIVQVTRADFGEGVMDGVNFQRKIERLAFDVGGGKLRAPVQRVGDYLKNKSSSRFGEVKPTYSAGTTFAKMEDVLPPFITDAMRYAITDMDKRLRGFAHPDALLTAPETRTSSPVRIERGENYQSISHRGIYPCGEGAGYAGGITSSAVDGIKIADAIYKTFA